MTPVILKPNQFIVEVKGDIEKILSEEVPFIISVSNPHKAGEGNSAAFKLIEATLKVFEQGQDKFH